MNEYKNLADPDFEPSDAQLLELSRRAFAHIREENAVSAQQMQERIAKKQLALFQKMTHTSQAI
jgi:hypothetical protein